MDVPGAVRGKCFLLPVNFESCLYTFQATLLQIKLTVHPLRELGRGYDVLHHSLLYDAPHLGQQEKAKTGLSWKYWLRCEISGGIGGEDVFLQQLLPVGVRKPPPWSCGG